jgi:positive regulator of sigma E activity
MKPSIPDTGTVIKLDGERAVVRMHHEGSCRKCGAAALGLCKMGQMQVLTVRNTQDARVGDRVKIGLDEKVQARAYVLAFIIPPAALIVGSVAGHSIGTYSGFPAIDIISGVAWMIAGSFFSFRKLKRLDQTSSIEIVRVLIDPPVYRF